MGSCFGKQTESRKTSSKKLRSNQSDFPVFDEVSANKNNSRALDSTIVPSTSDLHLLNTTTHNTLTPHVGPQIMITGATPFPSSADVSALNASREEISSNQKAEETDEETGINVEISQTHEDDSERSLYLKSIGGKFLSQNGKFIEMVETKTAATELLLINSETDEGHCGMILQTKVGLLCMDILGYMESGITAGRPIAFTPRSGIESQFWKVTKENENFITIRPVTQDNLALQIISDFKLALMPFKSDEPLQMFTIE